MSEDAKTIKEVVDRAKNMDAEAFGVIYEMYYENIYKYIYFKIGNRAEAEDLTAQVFLGAMKSIKNYNLSDVPFASWLFRIAHNVVVDFWRKSSGKTAEPLDDRPDLTSTADTAAIAIGNLEYTKVQQILASLPEDQSKLLILRFIIGLTTNETAVILGKTVGAVKAQQFRALLKLRRLLGGEINDRLD